MGGLSRFGLCSRSFPFRVLSDFAPRRRLRGPRPAPEVGIRVRPESARDRYPSRFLPRASLFRSVRVGPIGAAGPFRLVTVIRVAFFRGRPDSASSESARYARSGGRPFRWPFLLFPVPTERLTGAPGAVSAPAAPLGAPDSRCSPTPAPLQAVPAYRASGLTRPRAPGSIASQPCRFVSSARPRPGSRAVRVVSSRPHTCAMQRPPRIESSMRAALADTAPRPVASLSSCSARAVVALGPRRDVAVASDPGHRGSWPPIRRGRRPGPGSSRSRRRSRARAGQSWGVGCARALVPRVSVPRPTTCSGLARQSVPRAGGSSRRRPSEPAKPRPAFMHPLRRRDSDSIPTSRVRCAAARFEVEVPTADLEACLRPLPTPPPGAPIAVNAVKGTQAAGCARDCDPLHTGRARFITRPPHCRRVTGPVHVRRDARQWGGVGSAPVCVCGPCGPVKFCVAGQRALRPACGVT